MSIKSLVVGAGPRQYRRPGHEEIFLDIRPFEGIDVVHDLNECPWPFENESFDEIVAIHVVEHLRDLVSFMDEAWSKLLPGGCLYIETPEAGTNWDLTHADPTHVRCYRKHTFINYFTRSEAPKFGYTTKYWSILDIRTQCGNIQVHLQKVGT